MSSGAVVIRDGVLVVPKGAVDPPGDGGLGGGLTGRGAGGAGGRSCAAAEEEAEARS